MENNLIGFKFEYQYLVYGKVTAYVSILLERRKDRKFLLSNCNGTLKDIDITEVESQFIDDLYDINLGSWNKEYKSLFDMSGKDYHWELDISFNDQHLIFSGYNSFPYNIETFFRVLRKYGMSIPIKKSKKN